jgi:hypothetical protein
MIDKPIRVVTTISPMSETELAAAIQDKGPYDGKMHPVLGWSPSPARVRQFEKEQASRTCFDSKTQPDAKVTDPFRKIQPAKQSAKDPSEYDMSEVTAPPVSHKKISMQEKDGPSIDDLL